ncbi:MAG: hypothetical protein C0404_07820 [Verrucomicrobia bacterium]|nr:hypothetical protein [Verrucomicrobiota bacterium]
MTTRLNSGNKATRPCCRWRRSLFSGLFATLLLVQASAGGERQDAHQIASSGIKMQNGVLQVTVQRDARGPRLTGQREGAQVTAELVLCSRDGARLPSRVETSRIDESTEAMDINAEGAEARLLMHRGKPFVEVRPGKGAVALELRTGARYAVLPDFFADDVVFDPGRTTAASQLVQAENFLFLMLDGQDTILMCTWAGSLDRDKPAASGTRVAAGEQPDVSPEPGVELIFSGRNPDRKVWARIEFQGGPIYVALLEHKGLWHDEKLSSLPAYQATALEWQRPFEARWRADFIVAEGKVTTDWKTRNQSFPVLGPKDFQGAVVFDDEKKIRVWMESLGYVNYPCFFWERETRICTYVDKEWRDRLEARKVRAEQLPNIYERVLIYPMERAPDTPAAVFTPADIMRDTLGIGPCEYVLGREKIRPDDSPLFGLELGVCSTIDKVIIPTIDKYKGKTLDDEAKTTINKALQHILSFMQAVNRRVRDYKAFGKDMTAFCKEEASRNPKLKPLAGKIMAHLDILNAEKAVTDEGKVMKYDRGTLAYWEKVIPELITLLKAGDTKRLPEVFVLKEGLAEAQDRLIGRQRRCVKALRQEAMLQDSDDPAVRKFAGEILKRCNDVLHNRHPKEGV